MQMSPDLSTIICREHLAVLSVQQSHKAPPPCALFSYLVTFELTLQDSAHLLLASCCVSVLWISHLLCAAGNAAALHCLLLPSPLSYTESCSHKMRLRPCLRSSWKLVSSKHLPDTSGDEFSLPLLHYLSKKKNIEEWKCLCFIFPCTCFLLSFLLSSQCCLGLSLLSRLIVLLPPTH